jgi:NinB protein
MDAIWPAVQGADAMSDRQIFRLVHLQARDNAKKAIGYAPDGYIVTICAPKRSLDQNAALWPLLAAISKQLDWYGQRLSDSDWKDVLTASLKKQRAVPGIDGNGFVILGQRTSQMNKKDFSDLLDLATAFAIEKGVQLDQ